MSVSNVSSTDSVGMDITIIRDFSRVPAPRMASPPIYPQGAVSSIQNFVGNQQGPPSVPQRWNWNPVAPPPLYPPLATPHIQDFVGNQEGPVLVPQPRAIPATPLPPVAAPHIQAFGNQQGPPSVPQRWHWNLMAPLPLYPPVATPHTQDFVGNQEGPVLVPQPRAIPATPLPPAAASHIQAFVGNQQGSPSVPQWWNWNPMAPPPLYPPAATPRIQAFVGNRQGPVLVPQPCAIPATPLPPAAAPHIQTFVGNQWEHPSVPRWAWNSSVDWSDLHPNDAPLNRIKNEEPDDVGLLDMTGLISFDEVEPVVAIAARPVKMVIEQTRTVHPGTSAPVYTYPETSSTRPTTACIAQETSTVPGPIPKDVQALIDAYIQCTPVLCIVSNACMNTSWGRKLPEEVGFAYLGFHSVVGVQETRLGKDSASSDATGTVEWRFKLRWGSGGEEHLGFPSDAVDITTPWWLSQLDTSMEPASNSTSSPNDTDLSTPYYKDRRAQNHNYRFRNMPIAHCCPSILPFHLLVPHNDGTELGFGPEQIANEPKGYYCADCGKLNRITMMRHRRCSSSFCASKKSQKSSGYSLSLDCIRGPHQTLPVYLPNNTLPPGVNEPTCQSWPDGMMVLCYILGTTPPADGPVRSEQPSQRPQRLAGEVSVHHVFTGNSPLLQSDATELLESIQIGCELVRDANESPYFSHTAVAPETTWPECLTRARAVITKNVKTYIGMGEQEISIRRLIAKGWVDNGSRRGFDFLDVRGSGGYAAMMCLGNELVLKILPKSGFPDSNLGIPTDCMRSEIEEESAQALSVILSEPGPSTAPETPTKAPGKRGRPPKLKPTANQDATLGVTDNVFLEPPTVSDPVKKPTRGGSKKLSVPFTVTLVHGDILLLSGDDFDYSIVRSGTSILLVACGQ
ncbi:hypothetical protein DFH07DRAFT_580731 [Mycena maculata]|uniref:Uncharacterized protein n=1 Tax=Mycena maculata TaxID=230809 RepID=A0AAD7IQ26_9AGAR|nr:hypothetical protein DFH07DRAFT_580731 [Mycena maculata]